MFVLAHLSDPHLSPIPKARIFELAGKRATGLFNWWRKRGKIHRPDALSRVIADLKQQATDHIVVTGDLVNIALPGEFPPARAFLEMLGTPQTVTFVPGNHDAYVRSAVRHPQTHWGEFMRGDDDAPGGGFPFLRRRGPIALIGLSSAVPTLPIFATGRIGVSQMRLLVHLLDCCRSEGLFRVLLIHHSPTSKPSRYLKRLVDGSLLRRTLAQHGAELVLHGHNHRRQTVWLDGPDGRIPAVGVPSASATATGDHHPGGYNLYRIDGTAGAWRCEVISRGLAGDSVVETERAVLRDG